MEIIKSQITEPFAQEHASKPVFYRIEKNIELERFKSLFFAEDSSVVIHDQITGQLKELIKSLHPAIKISEDQYPEKIRQHLAGRDLFSYGVWVYYPWNNNLVHLLDEEEFVEIRTNRNRYKITPDEQALLSRKKIGVVGLSVGQSIALTLAMERTCGELRLADFDTAELSNLNRIRTGVHNLGLKKTIIAAREIAEIDPFLQVSIFSNGLNNSNIEAFFCGDGKLDLLVEVCDGLDIKILSRFKAKELGIPVVMDTNDRGMVDVERFDLEPERPILHGLAEGLDPENIKELTNEQKIPYILKMVGADQISTRLKASMLEVEQSINTWPQLASSVVLGGAITTDVCRRILLDQYHESGRYYIDIEELIGDREGTETAVSPVQNPYQPLSFEDVLPLATQYILTAGEGEFIPPRDKMDKIVDAAIAAPSAGNNQPWKFLLHKNVLFIFHDKYRSYSWGDYYEMGAHMSLGATVENIHLQTAALGVTTNIEVFPLADNPVLIAAIKFSVSAQQPDREKLRLASGIYTRCTNRNLGERKPLPIDFYQGIEYFVKEMAGTEVTYTDKEADLDELGDIIAACDRIRLLHEQGHEEFYSEIRWSKAQAEATGDGIELAAVDLTPVEVAGFNIAQDWKALSLLADWNKGQSFKKLSVNTLKSASAMVLFTVPALTHENLVNVGRAVERAWIYLNQEGVSVHPMLSPVFFFNRMVHGKGAEINSFAKEELAVLKERFDRLFALGDSQTEAFLMKLAVANEPDVRSLRKAKQEVFYER